jgi:hypothetical protein
MAWGWVCSYAVQSSRATADAFWALPCQSYGSVFKRSPPGINLCATCPELPCRAQKIAGVTLWRRQIAGETLLLDDDGPEGWVFRLVLWAIAAIFRPRTQLIAENLCLRQQLLRGTRRHRSGRARVAAQFEFTRRQIDLIGEWERVDTVSLPQGAIVSRGQAPRSHL